MASTRLNVRTLLLIVAEALLIFLAMVTAAHLRLGWSGAYYELNEKGGFLKAVVVTAFCLAAFYDLYIQPARPCFWQPAGKRPKRRSG